MRRPHAVLALLLGLGLIISLATPVGQILASPARQRAPVAVRDDANTLTILTCCGMPSGFTAASEHTSNTIFQFYHYYNTLWAQRFPHLRIKEIDVSSYGDLLSKTILGVNAGDPPDLIATQGQLGQLVARQAVLNLDQYYARDHITASLFLPALANWARISGHWYAMPENSNPSQGELLYLPQVVKAAGWDLAHLPLTWDALWTATQKVTKRDQTGTLVRIGLPVRAPSAIETNQYCGYFAIFDARTGRFHADLPCIRAYFRYEQRLLTFYGGIAAYTKFTSADPTIWSCSPKAYIPTGRIVFSIDAYWSGDQMDQCYNVQWALSPPPTPHGAPVERRTVTTTAQQIEIPTGAKHAQLAWDFAKFTFWDHGDVQAPTGDGYAVAAQADSWYRILVETEGRIRASHHYRGNPMAAAVPLVKRDAQVGQAYQPTAPAASYYDTQMQRAWQQVAYGRATVDQALAQAQRAVDTQQSTLRR